MHNCIVHFWPDWSQIITMQIPGTYKGTNSTHMHDERFNDF